MLIDTHGYSIQCALYSDAKVGKGFLDPLYSFSLSFNTFSLHITCLVGENFLEFLLSCRNAA
jgi:hypothetical protein